MIPLLVVVTNAGPLICSNGSTTVRWAQRSAAGTESGCTSQGVVETITMDDIYSYLSWEEAQIYFTSFPFQYISNSCFKPVSTPFDCYFYAQADVSLRPSSPEIESDEAQWECLLAVKMCGKFIIVVSVYSKDSFLRERLIYWKSDSTCLIWSYFNIPQHHHWFWSTPPLIHRPSKTCILQGKLCNKVICTPSW